MELYKLQILAGQASSGHHCISIPRTSVGRCAAEIGSSITPGRKMMFNKHNLSIMCTEEEMFVSHINSYTVTLR